jgi:hypothetical protein
LHIFADSLTILAAEASDEHTKNSNILCI